MMRFLVCMLLVSSTALAQEFRSVDAFKKISVGPHIDLVLVEGEHETVTLSNLEVDDRKINVKVEGSTLHIFLDKAKSITKQQKTYVDGYKRKEPIYRGRVVTATVSYKYLKKITVKGEEKYLANNVLDADNLKLKMYGEGDMRIPAIESQKLKVKLYGTNRLRIDGGSIQKQKYKSYGENIVNCQSLESLVSKSTNFGESTIRLHASRKVKVTALGESVIGFAGVARLSKGLVIGENQIYRIN